MWFEAVDPLGPDSTHYGGDPDDTGPRRLALSAVRAR